MEIETITDDANLLIRRLKLASGEAMYWHTDACRRAINRGPGPYEEVVTFYRTAAGHEPQPRFDNKGQPHD